MNWSLFFKILSVGGFSISIIRAGFPPFSLQAWLLIGFFIMYGGVSYWKGLQDGKTI